MSVKSWELSDELWSRLEPLLPQCPGHDPKRTYQLKPGGGRKRANPRKILEGIFYVLRTGCQWNAVPRRYGGGSTIHCYFQHWTRTGFFENAWKAGLKEYDELKEIEWEWQSINGAMTKAPLGGEATGPNPTDRGKKGTKRHLLLDGRGVPLSLVATGTNVHDVKKLEATLHGIIIPLPADQTLHLCADAGYVGKEHEKTIIEHGYVPHVRGRNEERSEKDRISGHKARRWVVEACHSWLYRFRKILVRFEKTLESHLALLHFAFAVICWKKVIQR